MHEPHVCLRGSNWLSSLKVRILHDMLQPSPISTCYVRENYTYHTKRFLTANDSSPNVFLEVVLKSLVKI